MFAKVTTLIENCVKGRGVRGEHGLSILFEVNGKKILFDTGASDLFLYNAKVLSKDIKDVDYLVLSHGHSDHTGGLRDFMQVNSKAKIICKQSILIPKYRGCRNNGIGNIESIDHSRFVFIDSLTEIIAGVYIVPDIKIINECDTHFADFELLTEQGRVADKFDDEVAMVLENDGKLSLFSACSHRGITNILSAVKESLGNPPIKYLVGGFHTSDSHPSDTLFIAEYLKETMPEHIGVCHCTGINNFAILKNLLGDRVFYNYCGSEIII